MAWVVKASPVIQQLQEMLPDRQPGEFHVGDRVKFSKKGLYEYGDKWNGEDTIGTVVEVGDYVYIDFDGWDQPNRRRAGFTPPLLELAQ